MAERYPALRPKAAAPRRAAGGELSRRSVAEELAAALRERILSGELPGGSLLRQEALAEAYGVSRIPVREALRLLEGEGLVQLQLHRGALVTAHSADEIGELFDLRAMLERDLIERAVPRTTPADVARSEGLLRRIEAAYAEGDAHARGALNTEFHRSLYLPAGREQTLALLASVSLVTERYIRLYHTLIEVAAARAQVDHAEILEHVRAGRAREAGDATARHVQFTRRTLMEALESRLAATDRAEGARGR